MNLKSLFFKNKIEIIPVKNVNSRLVFYVKNGKGLLCGKYGSGSGQGLYSLVFDGVPLTKFHGDEYLCPTCEKLISAGYGLDKCKDDTLSGLSDIVNAPFQSMEKSFDDLKPLLGLLPTGYYLLSDEELFPTDGNGSFFWCVNNTPKINRATCPVHDTQSFDWSSPLPKYLLPTQPPTRFNADRASFYKDKDDSRAIGYYQEGYLCALIDGHHKATAAALCKRPVKTLVITAAYSLTLPHPQNVSKASINFGNIQLFEDELLCSWKSVTDSFQGRRMTEIEMKRYLSMQDKSFDDYPWPREILDTSKAFYDVYTLACLEWAGDLSNERLTRIVANKEPLSDSTINHIVNALYATGHPRFIEIAIYICKKECNVHIWHDVFSLLARIKNQMVEDFFIDFLINDEKLRPSITEIIDDYFEQMQQEATKTKLDNLI